MQKFSTIFLSVIGVFGSAFASIAATQRSSPFPATPNKNSQDKNSPDTDIDESTMDTLPDAEQLLELREIDRLCSGNQPLDNADLRSVSRDAHEHLQRHFSSQTHTD
jgi:hypothetical protein